MYLEFHMNEHKGITPYVCDFEGCDYKSISATSLSAHKKSHNSTMRTRCPKCREYLFSPESGEKHEREHHDPDLPWTCGTKNCEYRAESEAEVKNHSDRIHPEMMQCAHCIVTLTKTHMSVHLKIHHSEGLPHECPECGFR